MMRVHAKWFLSHGKWMVFSAIAAAMTLGLANQGAGDTRLGIFEGSGDVGTVLHVGSVTFDSASGKYTVAGSGENMWSDHDAFQFVWKKASGDAAISAEVAFLGEGKNPHRKAVLIIRQSLEADSPYVDVALHGEGLTSLQYRDEKGAATHEIQANISAPQTLQLEKHGEYFSMLLARKGEKVAVAGGSIRVAIEGEYYVGIAVCSHEKEVVEKAVFSNVNLRAPGAGAQAKLYSTLETISIDST